MWNLPTTLHYQCIQMTCKDTTNIHGFRKYPINTFTKNIHEVPKISTDDLKMFADTEIINGYKNYPLDTEGTFMNTENTLGNLSAFEWNLNIRIAAFRLVGWFVRLAVKCHREIISKFAKYKYYVLTMKNEGHEFSLDKDNCIFSSSSSITN